MKELTLPSELESLEVVDTAALECASLAGFDKHEAGEVAMAVIEAVTNAVAHGNRYRPETAVTVNFRWKPGEVCVVVKDEGEGFELSVVPDPTDPERFMAYSGRGIFIMRSVMDSVEFDMAPGTGTTVTMAKRMSVGT